MSTVHGEFVVRRKKHKQYRRIVDKCIWSICPLTIMFRVQKSALYKRIKYRHFIRFWCLIHPIIMQWFFTMKIAIHIPYINMDIGLKHTIIVYICMICSFDAVKTWSDHEWEFRLTKDCHPNGRALRCRIWKFYWDNLLVYKDIALHSTYIWMTRRLPCDSM